MKKIFVIICLVLTFVFFAGVTAKTNLEADSKNYTSVSTWKISGVGWEQTFDRIDNNHYAWRLELDYEYYMGSAYNVTADSNFIENKQFPNGMPEGYYYLYIFVLDNDNYQLKIYDSNDAYIEEHVENNGVWLEFEMSTIIKALCIPDPGYAVMEFGEPGYGMYDGTGPDAEGYYTYPTTFYHYYKPTFGIPHTHSFTYSANINYLIATCGNSDCTITNSKLAISLSTPDYTYDGKAYPSASIVGTSDWEAAGLTTPTIEYFQGSTKLSSAPTEGGSYTAKMTLGNATATSDFKIIVPDNIQFANYKGELVTELQKITPDCQGIIANALTEIGKVNHDGTKSLDDNKAVVKAIFDQAKDAYEKATHPAITEGAKSKVVVGSEDMSMTFTSNANRSYFIKVTVDGADVDASNYDLAQDTISVKLHSDYVKTLSAGEHTLSIYSEGGHADTTFTIAEKEVAKKANLTWLIIVIIVIVVLVGAYFAGYFFLYKKGKLDNSKIKVIYSIFK